MGEAVQRPIFYEGQILAADDLTATVSYEREQLARHERCLHSWGIAQGLTLKGEKRKIDNKSVVSVTVSDGIAIDGAGLGIIVPEPELVSESDFVDSHVTGSQPPDAWYPVFLVGVESAAPKPALAVGACDSGRQRRTVEGYRIVFGRPGTAAELDEQTPPKAGDPPTSEGGTRWRVLLGFVQWEGEPLNHFTAVADSADGIGRRYAGVRASEVSAHAGKLTLRTRDRQANQKLAVVLDDVTDGGKMVFGVEDKKGGITPLLTVNAKGDLTAVGKLAGGGSEAGVYAESGIATDGVLLPLPTGITQEQVDQGKVALQILVTTRFADLAAPPQPAAPAPPIAYGAAVPLRCVVENMRVKCAVRWLYLDTTAVPVALKSTDVPASCDYLVLAVVPAAAG